MKEFDIKKIRILLIIIIIVNLILFGILLIYNINNKKKNEQSANKIYSNSSAEMIDRILPENRVQFEEKVGNKEDCQVVYVELYNYVYFIKQLYPNIEKLNDDELKAFYEKNVKSINSRYFVYNSDDFTKLVNNLKKAYNEESNVDYKTVILYPDTYKKGEKYSECDFEIVLKNGKSLKYKLNIAKNNNTVILNFKPTNEV